MSAKRVSITPCEWCGAVGWLAHPSRPQPYCSTKCGGLGRAAKQSRGVENRFWSTLIRRGNGCWEWPRAQPDGYGRIRHMGKFVRTHRHAYVLAIGPVPDELLVCHHCDNPLCCNPEHLFLGTEHDNTQDMMRKGRGCIAESHPRAKITWDDVTAIREATKGGSAMMAKFGLSRSQVKRIRRGESWK